MPWITLSKFTSEDCKTCNGKGYMCVCGSRLNYFGKCRAFIGEAAKMTKYDANLLKTTYHNRTIHCQTCGGTGKQPETLLT